MFGDSNNVFVYHKYKMVSLVCMRHSNIFAAINKGKTDKVKKVFLLGTTLSSRFSRLPGESGINLAGYLKVALREFIILSIFPIAF